MTYFLSQSLPAQSGSVMQVVTGIIPNSISSYHRPKEFMHFDFSPNGEYFLEGSLFGTGSHTFDTHDYDKNIHIWQSQSANGGFRRVASVGVKGMRADDYQYPYADAPNRSSPLFISNDTILWAGGGLDEEGTGYPDDWSAYANYRGVFGVITGSGANWGFSQVITASATISTTAQSRDANPGAATAATSSIGDFFQNSDGNRLKITTNNRYTSTAPTRAAIHTHDYVDDYTDYNHTLTIFKSSSLDSGWSFHSQFNMVDLEDYTPNFGETVMQVQDMTWIDEDNIIVVYSYDSTQNYHYMFPLTFDSTSRKWRPSMYDGSQVQYPAYRKFINSDDDNWQEGGGLRKVVYDPYGKRLITIESTSTIYIYHSGTDWMKNDLVGNNWARGSGASSAITFSNSQNYGFGSNSQYTRFRFASGSTTMIGLDYNERYTAGFSEASRGRLRFVESSSVGGWTTAAGSSNKNGVFVGSYFDTGSHALELGSNPSGEGLTVGLHSYTRTEWGQGAKFAWNAHYGGDGNTLMYRESKYNSSTSTGANQVVTNRFPVLALNAFPAANPSLDASVTETVGASGGTVKAGGTQNSPTVTVTIGSGDLDGNTSLTAAVVSDAAVKAQNLTAIKKEAGSAGAHFVGDIVRLTPHGTEFNSAVQVQFELDSAPADLTIWKRDSHDGDYTQWYQLPSTYWSASGTTITINTTRFSEYAGLGGINVARTKLSNTQLATLTTTDLVASTSIQISGSSNSFKDRTVAGDDLFLIEDKSNGTTYHVSASQMAEYFGGLVSVTASSDNSDMRVTFVSPSDNADIGLAVDAGLKYNPSTDMLKGVNLSGSGDLTMAGSATIDDNLILTKGYVQIKASELNVTGGIKASSVISGSSHLQVAGNTDLAGTLDVVGLISGSGGLDIGGTADFGAAVNVDGALSGSSTLAIKGATALGSNLTVEGLISGSGGVKAKGAISGSSDLTIAGSATIDDNLVITKGYVHVAADNMHITGAVLASSHISGAGDLSAGGTLAVDGAATLRNTLTVSGGNISGSADFTLAGSATVDDNIIATKGYVQVKAGNVHVTGNVLAQQIKGTAISGSGNLTIAGDATIAGDFTVNGDLTYINTTNLAVEDSLILLGSGSSGSPVNDQGIILERGASANAAVVFDESNDRFAFAYVGTASAGSTGNLDVALGAPVSASAFYGDGSNLTGVGAATVASNNDNNELALTFVSGAGLAAATLFTDASVLKYNTSTDTLKSVAFSASSTITAKGIISGSSHLRIAGDTDFAGTLDVVGLISGSGGIDIGGAADFGSTVKAQGNISGSSDLTIAGSATVDDNVILTKGYLQVKADNMHITGNVLSSGLIKGTTLSGSGDLTIAGSATIDDNLILTKGYVQIKASELNVTGGIKASSVISGSSHLQVAGNTDLAGTLDVVGLISGSGGLDIGGAADFGSTVKAQGILSGSSHLQVAGNTSLAGTLTSLGLISGSSGMDLAGTADFGGAVNIQGNLDVDGTTTVDAFTASDTVTLTSVAALTLDTNDTTHHILVTDSDDNIVKKESVKELIEHITGAAGTRGGLQVHQGKLHIVQKEESFMSSSLTGHAHTASLGGPVLSGSLMVFLNGLLQTRSGSANLGAGANSIFDYRLDSYTAPTKVLMADALDSDDVLIVRYVQK